MSESAPWATLLWDDPITPQAYVVHVLERRFGFERERARELMAHAERDGSVEVARGAREEQEMLVARLHTDGLIATLERVAQ